MNIKVETEDENWKEVKLINETRNFQNGKAKIFIKKIQNNSTTDGSIFWAIDDVRLCERIEYRYMISEQEEFKCQKVEIEDSKIIKVETNVTISTPERGEQLTEDQKEDILEMVNQNDKISTRRIFSVLHISQSTVFRKLKKELLHPQLVQRLHPGDNIPRSRLCRLRRSLGMWKAFLELANFGHSVGTCFADVALWLFDAEHEKWICVNGKCRDQYKGERCDKLPASEIIFKNAPKVVNSGETCYQVENISEVDRNSKFQEGDWMVAKHNMKMQINERRRIDNLDPDTFYRVRATVVQESKTFNGDRNHIKSNQCHTKCNLLKQKDILARPSNISIIVDIVWPEHKCKLSRYTFSWNNASFEKLPNASIPKNNLEPNTKYSIAINDSSSNVVISKILETQGAPEIPYEINVDWGNNNDMNISWKINGPLPEFDIWLLNSSFQRKLLTNDHSKFPENNTYTLKVPHTKLLGLEACKEYEVFIKAQNAYGSNKNSSIITIPPDIPQCIKNDVIWNSTNETISLSLSYTGTYPKMYEEKMYIVILKSTKRKKSLEDFAENLLKRKIVTENGIKLVYESTRVNNTFHFQIGHKDHLPLPNPPLEPGTNYSVALFLTNECNSLVRMTWFRKYIATSPGMNKTGTGKSTGYVDESEGNEGNGDTEGNSALWALVLLLFLPLAGVGFWWKKKKGRIFGNLLIPYHTPDEEISLSQLPSSSMEIHGGNPNIKPVKLPPHPPLLNTTHTKKVRVTDLQMYAKDAIERGELEREHNLFPNGLVRPCEYGSLQENKSKNRYKNLIAYDDTRVKLKKIRGDEYSDYINANYIDGYGKPRCYIATQGPKSNTLADFWRMIWQERVRNIVMMANIYEGGKLMVEKYWPDISEDITFENIRVQHVTTDVFANFEQRVFYVYCKKEKRKIEQLHFTSWPNHGVPLYPQSLVTFLQRMQKIPYNPQMPILVHCRAGVGRTGTIILSDICLRMAAIEGSVDFLGHLENMRNQRANLVDNAEQYKLAHLVVLECLLGMRTAIPCTEEMYEVVGNILGNNGIKKEMKYISETQWVDAAMETMLENSEVLPCYPEKNRFQEIVPKHYRVHISRYPIEDKSSSYINAVMVDGFRNPGRYIVTQQPMPNTLAEFWRMVLEKLSTVIVSLNTLNLNDKTVCKFWPEKDQQMNPVDYITIQHIKTQRLDCYKVITVQVQDTSTRVDTFPVHIVEMDNWNSDELTPKKIEEFLFFIDASDVISRNSQQVIVTCYDGATASGLYLAMIFLIEKMKLEKECDVCSAVRSIRHSRGQFVTTKEQYEFLYRASVSYRTGFQSHID
ncbi:hypothetical protein JTB14_014851 [Gonioctena quinquepunctata]|nr:hypothetical protein JTB14_014851 [Gonioctena quinquepunctata]